MSDINQELDLLDGSEYTKTILLGSYLTFLRTFFELRTGRPFSLSNPTSRESHFISIAKALKRVFNGECKRLIINVPPRYGKAIDVKTNILTIDGWKKAKDVVVGDKLIGSSGYTRVTGVYKQGILPASEISFSDGYSVVCNDDHLWTIKDRDSKEWFVKKTSEIKEFFVNDCIKRDCEIPRVNGNFGTIPHAISPYLLGFWLASGNQATGEIITSSHANNDYLSSMLRDYYSSGIDVDFTERSYRIICAGFVKDLKSMGVLKRARAPSCIYSWDYDDRLLMLRGVMDAVGATDKWGVPTLSTNSDKLLSTVRYLVASLSGTTTLSLFKSCNETAVKIVMPVGVNVFMSSPKKIVSSYSYKSRPVRKIESIKSVGNCEMVCFSVDAEDKLFAVGEGLVLTHNSEMMCNFVAWSMANYSDSSFIYTSYAQSLASMQTNTIRDIISLPFYKRIFDVELDDSTTAKDDFKTTAGGSVFAAGAGGPITGRGAGIKGVNRFGGCIIVDDAHKPEEVHSDTMRVRINNWFFNTLQSRLNDKNTPIIAIGQILHEDDLLTNLKKLKNNNGLHEWEVVSLEALDAAGNALYPEMHDKETLQKMERDSPYVFSSQYQQNPMPAGGGIFNEEWFTFLDKEPDIISTFITADTAETDKNYNDATVFSFFGIYKIVNRGIDSGLYGLHWLDCRELRCEPKDLEGEFYDFYSACMRHKVKPTIAAIEKKSTGVTLCSILKDAIGLRVIEVDRNRASGSKTTRFLQCQPYVSSKRITFTDEARHAGMCIEHCKKITVNNTHRHDDIADTMQTAIQIALIEETLLPKDEGSSNQIFEAFNRNIQNISNLRRNR